MNPTPANFLFFKSASVILGAALMGSLAQTARAANGNDTWLGNSSVNWSLAANWTSGSANKPPIGGDSLFFGFAGSAGSALNNDIAANTAFNGIIFSSGADALTLSGNAINLAGNVSDNAVNPEIINLPMALTASHVCSVTNGGDLVLGGVISGTGFNLSVNTTTAVGNTITPVNAGTVTLNGSAVNTYTGATIISGGTLLLDFANLASPVNLINSSSSLTLGGLGGGTLNIKGKSSGATSQTFGNVSLSKNCGTSIVLNPNGGTSTTLTLGNTWNRNGGANSLNIDLSAGGTLTSTPSSLAANNVLGFATVKDATGAGLASLAGGNIVRLTGQTTLPTSGTSGTVNYITSGNTAMSAASFSANSLTLDASSVPGVLNLGGASDVMSLTSLGLLMLGANNYTITNGQVGAANSELIVHQMGTGTLTINGTVSSGIGGLTKNGPGTLVLGAVNNGSFATINQGTVRQVAANALGSTNLSFIVNYGATMDLNGFNLAVGLVANSGAGQGMVTNSGALANFMVGDGNAAPDLANTLVCGPINLIITGGGAMGLSPANTHTGGTTFQNNTGGASNYRVNVASELGTGTLGFNGGGTLQNTTSLTITNPVTVNGTGNTWWLDAGVYGSVGPWSGNGTINILQDASKAPTFTFGGDLSGFQGTLQLTANTNTSASGLVFTYSLGGNGTFDGSQAIWDLYSTLGTFSSAPVLQWAGAGSQAIKLGDLTSAGTTGNGAIIVSNSVAGTTATFEVGNLNNNSTFSGALVSGAGVVALTKTGTGVWTLSGANTYTGATTVNGGTLLVNGSLATGSAVTVAGGTLGGTGTIGGSVIFNTGSHAVFTNGAVLTMSSPLNIATSGTIPDVHLILSNNVSVGNYTLGTYKTSGSSGVFNSAPVLDSGSFAAGTTGSIVTSGGNIVLQVTATSVGTTTTVATSGSPAAYGQTVTFTATVVPASGTTVPTGTVQFRANGVALGSPVAVTAGISSDGVAAINTASLPVSGSPYSITAEYTATGNFASSTNSPALIQIINQQTPALAEFSSENPSGYKDAVYFSATLPADATGSVVFSSTNGSFSTNSVSAGAAVSASLNSLPRGTNLITAVYSGDSNYLGATNSLLQVVTNHPPIATQMTVTRTAGLNLLISLPDLATNWSDVDGDNVKLTGLNLVTTNGVNSTLLNTSTNADGSYVITNSAYIGYTNNPGVNDQFSYTISDGQGGTNMGLINIVINPFTTGQQTGIMTISNGVANLTFFAVPGYSYITERTTNLAPAVWVDISTNAAAANGVINVNDNFGDLGAPPQLAYYRLKWRP